MSRIERNIPEIDLSLLPENRDQLLNDLKHALIDHGFFYITNYDEYLDENIVLALSQEVDAFFKLPNDQKNQIQMVNSKHFLGYNGLEKEDEDSTIGWSEQVEFCSLDEPSEEVRSVFDNLIGPNQYPSETVLPLFKKSVKDFFTALNDFSIFFTRIIFDTLKIRDFDAKKYIDFENPQSQFAKMKAIHYPSKTSLEGLGKIVSDEGYEPRKYSDFLTFLFEPTPTAESLELQDIYGEWIKGSPKPKAILCMVGQTLEYLTDGVCISNIHRVVTPKKQPRLSIPFFQNVRLPSKLEPFKMSQLLIKERDERDKVRQQDTNFQFKPKFGEPLAKILFYDAVKAHRDVSKKWYPEVLTQIEEEQRAQEEREGTKNGGFVSRKDQPKHLDRVKKVFRAFDNLLMLNLMNHTADIKLYAMVPQIKSLTGFNVELKDLLQVAYIWPEFTDLKLSDNGDFIVDVDSVKDHLDFQMINKRIENFNIKVDEWYQKNKRTCHEIPTLDTSLLATKDTGSTTVGFKRQRTEILQKDNAKKKKSETTGKLSLLQRIKAKEKERLENQISPEAKYDKYLFDKLGQVLEILSLLRSDQPHSIPSLTERVVTSLSLTNALAEQEAIDLLRRLNKEFPKDFELYNGRSTSVLKWKDFNVNEFKEKLKTRLQNEKLSQM